HLGRFLVEFVSAYNSSKAQPDKKDAWKIYAHRLTYGLTVLDADLASPPANEHAAYVAKLAEQANRLLKEIMSSNTATPAPNALSAWLDQNPPKSKTVYKGVADAVIREGDKTA